MPTTVSHFHFQLDTFLSRIDNKQTSVDIDNENSFTTAKSMYQSMFKGIDSQITGQSHFLVEVSSRRIAMKNSVSVKGERTARFVVLFPSWR